LTHPVEELLLFRTMTFQPERFRPITEQPTIHTDVDMQEFTVVDYLISKVRFGVPRRALIPILYDRELDEKAAYKSCDKDKVRLAYADLLKWIVLGASKVNNTSDTDNGWSHTTAGYELSDDDIANLKAEANAIYKELSPESVIKRRSAFRIVSHGVKRATRDTNGMYMPHTISED
jgi:hypothetical protein